jgi:hypothetical protein
MGQDPTQGDKMKRTARLCSALLLLLVAGVMTTTAASAESTPLPDIHTALPGETYPVNLGAHLAGVSELESTGESPDLEAREFSALLAVGELTSLGTAALVFLGLEEGKEHLKCHTSGASEERGEVVIPNAEWHLVYTALTPGEHLELGVLMLFTTYTVLCDAGLFELIVKGQWLMRANVPTPEAGKEGDSTDIEIASDCSSPGVQELPYYYNDALTRVATTLLQNVGLGNKQACEAIAGTVLLNPVTGSNATMFSVLF